MCGNIKNNVTQVELLVKSLCYRRSQIVQLNKLYDKISDDCIDEICDELRSNTCPLCKYIEKIYPMRFDGQISFMGDCTKCIGGNVTGICAEYIYRCNVNSIQCKSRRKSAIQWLTIQINKWSKYLKHLKKIPKCTKCGQTMKVIGVRDYGCRYFECSECGQTIGEETEEWFKKQKGRLI